MADVRVTQLAVETLGRLTADVRVSQVVVETLTRTTAIAPIRVSQLVVETLAASAPAAGVRVSQLVVETLTRVRGTVIVDAGLDQNLLFAAVATVCGTVIDDGIG